MIDIKHKEDCVGCNACVQVCPVTCISMHVDEQGFKYPEVDKDKCINCHLCEKVCPVINQAPEREIAHAYAAKNVSAEIKANSSSGGVFYALAAKVIGEGGVVFGARFDENWEVVHDYTEDLEGIRAFQTSKYLQSRIEDNYQKAQQFLKEGRKVLFSGTPCQIAGLKLFLRKDYGEQLVTVDTACHGVPSPLVWREYLQSVLEKLGADISSVKNINFRDKRNGWERYGLRIVYVKDGKECEYFIQASKNPYMHGFIKDLYIRPSCFSCPAKCGKSGSNATLADFWGIQSRYPELYEKGYYSLVVEFGKPENQMISEGEIGNIEIAPVDPVSACKNNPAIFKSAVRPRQYSVFWDRWEDDGIDCLPEILNTMRPSIFRRLVRFSKKLIAEMIGRETLIKIIRR